MSLKVHHLNCGTMCPACERLVKGKGSWSRPGELVCHCLLLETAESLVLVDTGMGERDIAEPRRRLGSTYTALFKPRLSPDETAIAQIRALGFDPRDVRHIITTHLDLDHAGGLSDFPDAHVHVLKPELKQIQEPGLREHMRFRLPQFDHHPKWVVHEEQGENWFGFESIQAIPELGTDILLVPLIGHTKGHTGVAVDTGDEWLLHCGDAYYHHSELTSTPDTPAFLKFFEVLIQAKPSERIRNIKRLRELAASHGNQIEMFCAHDPVELERYLC
ncbi:MBL fold metallo-hydrolase [Pseudomonas sp. BN415]|uniref:MBL fold metallo-hydrolase n=1 Tax=Pseudomonas sp. BN415 TaxID=2567889 RepID=UPI00245464AC|nr:MBL fold metallo-hydrolase [Pseudomonas sp. BN415]MDH4580733.1 MBL fold metallo-hydrolase [Pseudomonas sp. BN415]